MLKESPHLAPLRPTVGISPQLSDAELVTLAVLQALLGFTSEARWIRHVKASLRHLFPYVPQQPGYNKRLRAARGLVQHCVRALASSTALWSDDVCVVDSTPVECARSRETVRRSDLAGWAQYGYCASHSRWFWGLRLHLVCTLHGLPVTFALTGAKADERDVLLAMLALEPALAASLPGHHRRQELLRPRLRESPGRSRAGPAATRPQRRAAATGQPVLPPAAAGHRVRQRHPQRPARPGTPRRPHRRRRRRPRPAAHPRPRGRHMAQRRHRPGHQALTSGLRPLKAWNRSSSRPGKLPGRAASAARCSFPGSAGVSGM
jgi:DDE family transposase